MANLDAPVGMWPVVGTGGSTSPRISLYQVVSGFTTRIGSGSPVVLTATGIKLLTRANTTNTGSTNILGVAVHAWVSNSASHDLSVFDSPTQRFLIQADDASILATSIGANFSFLSLTDVNQVNTTTLRSKQELDGSTGNVGFGATTGSRPLKLVAISGKVDKDEVASSWTGCIVEWVPQAHIWAKNLGQGI